ncbi:MAG: NAD(P)H-dependent oxidoreductase subunit E [Bdellovibrionales bacterium]|nr:NAD(P)H-dependent oxidoreductase subunit E [Bdellovibrionales bacterium]
MFKLSDSGIEFIKKELERYESKLSAIIPALYRVQKEHGWVSPDAVVFLAEIMDIPESQINEVLKFYTMFNQKPVGKKHVQVCCNLSCAMNGGRELVDHLCKSFNVKPGEVSEDGQVTVTAVECLGSCGTAPMMQVNDAYYENLNHESAVEIIKKLEV